MKNVCMYVCTYVRTYVRMYVCMYVCVYIYICVFLPQSAPMVDFTKYMIARKRQSLKLIFSFWVNDFFIEKNWNENPGKSLPFLPRRVVGTTTTLRVRLVTKVGVFHKSPHDEELPSGCSAQAARSWWRTP